MKRLLTGMLFVFILNTAFSQSKDIEAIKSLNEAWLKSYPARDSLTLSKILADDFILVNPRGINMTKTEVLHSLHSPEVETVSVHIDSVGVRLFGDMGLITCKTTFILRMNNKESTGKNCYSDLYAKRNGRWSAVAAHVTLLSME
ncbi:MULTISPECIES: nuclear transport factor 2 family protein [Niastella]|uniref:Nuclear transport factor 2 family protein n=1 Tax=Niastella soli TaxID=2821487 RepID=A0ABS3YL75_9BACT|nr:nuclear transport factor 2 family protein [Niastella soli]MBO9198646.1 nuclear transport factor 2 family protein [Niastella soli]